MIIHHPKVIISPQKCPFFPQKPHLFNIFTLKNDLRTFVENCRESHLRDIMGQIAQDAWIRGWGAPCIENRGIEDNFIFYIECYFFLGTRGPLRTPLMSVVRCPSATKIPDSKLTQPLISFPSDSKLKQPLPQYTVHRTLNRINSRTFLAQFGLV